MLSETVLQIGNPSLRKVSGPVDTALFGTETLHQLAQSLLRLMHTHNGIGLAAPQVGLNKRIFVFGMEKNERRPHEKIIPTTILINPEWMPLTEEKHADFEACLSVGSTLMAQVPRYTKIAIKGFDIDGNLIETEAQGLHARVIQHEYDHLDGILFLDRVKDTKTIGYFDELRTYKII